MSPRSARAEPPSPPAPSSWSPFKYYQRRVSRSQTAANPRWSPAAPRSSELDRGVCGTAGEVEIFGAQNVTREWEQLSDDVLDGWLAP